MTIGNIARQSVRSGKIVPFVLNQLVGNPELDLEHVGRTNRQWINDSMRADDGEPVKAVADLNAKTEAERAINMLKNRATLAKYAVRAVRGFYYDDANGDPDPSRPVPSTPEGIEEVVMSLGDEIITLILIFVLNVENFRDRVLASPTETAKKS